MRVFLLCLLVAVAVARPRNNHRSAKASPYIVGGSDAVYGEFPYQASLQDGSFGYYYHICGASIYTEKYALTSGLCVFNEDIANPSYLLLVAGAQSISVTDGFEQSSVLSKITIQPNFNQYSYSSDVAILEIATPFTFDTPYVQPIPIPESGTSFSGNCVLSGWGLTSQNGEYPTVLQKVSVPLLTDNDCRVIYGTPDIEDSMICAGGGGTGGCQGDNGGPLACDDGTGTIYLAGISSWGYRCGVVGYPEVYAEVSYFTKWIRNNTP